MNIYVENLDKDPRVPILTRYPNKPLRTETLLPEEEWKSSGMYLNVCKPMKLEYQLIVVIHLGPTTYAAIGIYRPPEGKPFTQEECDHFGEYIPHFRRIIKLQEKFAKIEKERWAALSVLDDLPIGVIIADSQTRIQFTNNLAQKITAKGDGLIVRHNELWSNDQNISAKLRNAVRNGVNSVLMGKSPKGDGIALPRQNSEHPLYIRISPMWSNDTPYNIKDLSRPVVAIYITDPDLPQETQIELLQRLFGLTSAQASLTERLVAGRPVKKVAEDLGLTEHTVRSSIKDIFVKVGVSRQTELVKLVLAAPAWKNIQKQHNRLENQYISDECSY